MTNSEIYLNSITEPVVKYTFARFAEVYGSHWRHVKDELPRNNQMVMGHSHSGYFIIATYLDGVYTDDEHRTWIMDMWIPLPELVFVDEEEPKFHLGDKVRILSNNEEDFINSITKDGRYELLDHKGVYEEKDLWFYSEI